MKAGNLSLEVTVEQLWSVAYSLRGESTLINALCHLNHTNCTYMQS